MQEPSGCDVAVGFRFRCVRWMADPKGGCGGLVGAMYCWRSKETWLDFQRTNTTNRSSMIIHSVLDEDEISVFRLG